MKQNVSLMDRIGDSYYRNKPTIFVVTGMIGTAVSVYLAWRAGRKSDAVIAEAKNDILEVRAKRPEEGTEASITMGDYRRQLAYVYIKSAYKVGKVFAPALLTETAALAAIGVGYGILNERHLATVAAFNAQAKAFMSYRQRTAAKIGDEKEKELYYGYSEKEVEEPELDENGEPKLNKKGEPKLHKSKYAVLEEALAQHSMYARIYDAEHCKEFEDDDAYNEKVVADRCKYFNMTIRHQPYHMVTLNQIYQEFGFTQKAFGQVTGWHAHVDPVTKKMIFDGGDPDGIKAQLFPVWYNDDLTGELKKCYIIDWNVPGSILEYYDKENGDV